MSAVYSQFCAEKDVAPVYLFNFLSTNIANRSWEPEITTIVNENDANPVFIWQFFASGLSKDKQPQYWNRWLTGKDLQNVK